MTRYTLALLALCGASFAMPASANSEIEPGLWEFRTQADFPGQPDMAQKMAQMQEQMKNMPPQMRQHIEEQMAKMGVAMGQGGAMQVCITPEEAAAGPASGGQDDDCQYTNVERSGNTYRGEMICTDPPGRGEFVTTIHSARHFTTEATLDVDHGPHRIQTEAQWQSANCGNLAR